MIKKIIRKLISKYFTKYVSIFNTYSQAGEDAIVSFLFSDKKISTITYLDIGTNIPNYSNNTYLFYTRGSRGVCVEADKTLLNEIERVRPLDRIIFAGVAVSDLKEADFYIFNEKGINTFDKNEVEKRILSGKNKIMDVVKVPLININKLIKENYYKYPDFLSLDIEGLDLKVLQSLDFSLYPIPVICVETCAYSENHIRPKDKSISEFLLTKEYFVYADTYINTIFVNKKWFHVTT